MPLVTSTNSTSFLKKYRKPSPTRLTPTRSVWMLTSVTGPSQSRKSFETRCGSSFMAFRCLIPRNFSILQLATSHVHPQTQANLRRAVSTAYYALFHFVVDEACGNWGRPEQRRRLSRVFEHKQMYDASNRCAGRYKNAAAGTSESHLHSVASAFHKLQVRRHTADYDLSEVFSGDEVDLDFRSVRNAFTKWRVIQNEQVARDYLFSLLFRER
jgi:hypothetical protein